MRVRIIDLDGAVTGQPQVPYWLQDMGGDVIAARDLAPKLRLLAQPAAVRALAARLGPVLGPELVFYGSGDFHHLTLMLALRLEQKVSIIHFDNHPDWVGLPANLNCGSWVSRALTHKNVARIVTIGPASDDMRAPQLKGGDLSGLRAGRQEMHPWASGRTFYAGAGFQAPGVAACGGIGREGLSWQGLEGDDWHARMTAIAARLPDAPLWITLDKDVLTPAEAVTNWDQGRLTLEQVLSAIGRFAARRPILGMDVCGDYSPDTDLGLVRAILAHSDRAQRPVPATPGTTLNGATNARIVHRMAGMLQ